MTKCEQARLLAKDGKTDTEIAATLSVRPETVAKWRSNLEARGRPKGLTEGNRSLVPRIRAMRKGGMSFAEIGEALGMSRGWIRQLLLRGTAEGV